MQTYVKCYGENNREQIVKRDTLLATQVNVLQDPFNLTTPTRKSQIAFLSFCKIEATLAQLYRNVERRVRRVRGWSESITIRFIRNAPISVLRSEKKNKRKKGGERTAEEILTKNLEPIFV